MIFYNLSMSKLPEILNFAPKIVILFKIWKLLNFDFSAKIQNLIENPSIKIHNKSLTFGAIFKFIILSIFQDFQVFQDF